MGITNCLGNIMSILGPLVVGFIVTDKVSLMHTQYFLIKFVLSTNKNLISKYLCVCLKKLQLLISLFSAWSGAVAHRLAHFCRHLHRRQHRFRHFRLRRDAAVEQPRVLKGQAEWLRPRLASHMCAPIYFALDWVLAENNKNHLLSCSDRRLRQWSICVAAARGEILICQMALEKRLKLNGFLRMHLTTRGQRKDLPPARLLLPAYSACIVFCTYIYFNNINRRHGRSCGASPLIANSSQICYFCWI